MKNIKRNVDDSLRPEYRRTDFGEMVQGKYTRTQLQFRELVQLLLACIGEDEKLSFNHHSVGNSLAVYKRGDWTYELDNANQITLRYWLGESENVEEPISNTPCIMTPQQRTELQNLLEKHVRSLRVRVESLR